MGNYGLPGLDDGSVKKSILNMAPLMRRHYVVMEVKSNLIASERQDNLKRFQMPYFKKVANVVMGEASTEFKDMLLERKLKEKQDKSDAVWRQKQAAKKADLLRKKQVALRQKQLAE